MNIFLIFISSVLFSLAQNSLIDSGIAWYSTNFLGTWGPSPFLMKMGWGIIVVCTAAAIWFWSENFNKRKQSKHNQDKLGFQRELVYLALGSNILLNLWWQYLLFVSREFTLAAAVGVTLELSIIALFYLFSLQNRFSTVLLTPYFLWAFLVLYANYGLRALY